jgi:membrane-associated phospholipid phosphatase
MSFVSCPQRPVWRPKLIAARKFRGVRLSRQQRHLVAVAGIAAAVFIALTIVVGTSSSLGIDARAFTAAHDIRAPWLTHAARIITTFGLIAIVGPAVLLAAGLLARTGHRARAIALLSGAALTWVTVWITKWAVDRARPPAPLVHTTGQSYPSGHAANAVAWVALAIGLGALLRTRRARGVAIALGGALTVLIGLTRVYLRAHYASDVIAGYALAVTVYAVVALVVERRVTRIGWCVSGVS